MRVGSANFGIERFSDVPRAWTYSVNAERPHGKPCCVTNSVDLAVYVAGDRYEMPEGEIFTAAMSASTMVTIRPATTMRRCRWITCQ